MRKTSKLCVLKDKIGNLDADIVKISSVDIHSWCSYFCCNS